MCRAAREDIDARNSKTFAHPSVVRFYARATDLQPAERAIFDLHAADLRGAKLLDIGVGGGRTTLHLAPRVRRYVGVDYRPEMVHACGARFPDLDVMLADARHLPFANGEFDVAVFSHNGIDYVDSTGRGAILDEVVRVLAPNGLFIFATHNLLRADFALGERLPAWSLLTRFRRWRLRRANPDWRSWEHDAWALINDGAFGFRALTHHVKPSVQIATLEDTGFEDIRVFCGSTGIETRSEFADNLPSPWLYLACRKASRRLEVIRSRLR